MLDAVFVDAVFGGYFGIDKHGRHTAKCTLITFATFATFAT